MRRYVQHVILRNVTFQNKSNKWDLYCFNDIVVYMKLIDRTD